MKLGTLVSKTPLHLGAHWWMLSVTALLFVLVAVFVDLKPVVEESFSFPPAIPDSGNPKRSRNAFRRNRGLSWPCLPGTFHHPDTWTGSEGLLNRSRRSTRSARSRV